MPANFDLKTLNGNNGFTILGANPDPEEYYSVNTVGDVNDDGIFDIAIGSPYVSVNNLTEAGATYIVFGKSGSWNASLNVTTLDGNNGFVLYGRAVSEQSGYSVAGAGDVNNDGIADFMIGAPFQYAPSSSCNGIVYVVFGSQGIGETGTFDLSTLDGSNGFLITGAFSCGTYFGVSVSGAGDMNGDGIADIIIGTQYGTQAYIFYGRTGSWSAVVDIDILDGHNGFRTFANVGGFGSAIAVSGAGDMNGDGLSDCLIRGNGIVWVVFGSVEDRPSNYLDLTTLSSSDGFSVTFPDAGGIVPTSGIGGFGDINADGFADGLIGSPIEGSSYVIFGKTESLSLDIAALNGSNGFTFIQPADASGIGISLKFVRDFNGDNINDIVVGSGGEAFLVFGEQGIGASGTFRLSDLDGNNGIVFSDSIPNGDCGFSVSSAGDINGDGVSDLLIGAPGVDGGGQPGKAYVVFGYGAPELVTNQLTINQAETRVLNAANLNATDPRFPSDGLILTASNVQHGVFSWSNGTKPIFSFVQSAVRLGQILFIQDTSNLAPSYAISVTNPVPITTVPRAATVFFDAAPIIVNNTLTLKRSQTVMFTENELVATDIDSPAANLTFTISNIVHGQFSKVSQPTVPIVTFIQSQISAGQIQFSHDGGINPPSYNVLVNDGKMNDLAGPQPVNVHFDVGDLSSGSSNLSELVGSIAGALVAVGLLFFGSRYVLDKKNKKSVHDLLKSGASSYEIELQEYNRKIIGSIVNEIFDKIKTTNILSYRSEDATRSYVASIERMIEKLNEHRVNLDFDGMDVADRSFLMREIIQKTRQSTVSKQGSCFAKVSNFFSAEITPSQLDSKVDEIAFAVKESVTKSRPNLILEPGAPLPTSRVSVVRKLSTTNSTQIDDIKIVRVKN